MKVWDVLLDALWKTKGELHEATKEFSFDQKERLKCSDCEVI
jgi:hypothetical protein